RLAGGFPGGTVRTQRTAKRVSALGAVPVVADVGSDAVLEHGPYDVVLGLVGADNLHNSLRALNPGGRICFVGVGAGAKCSLNVLRLMNVRGRIHGSTLRSSP